MRLAIVFFSLAACAPATTESPSSGGVPPSEGAEVIQTPSDSSAPGAPAPPGEAATAPDEGPVEPPLAGCAPENVAGAPEHIEVELVLDAQSYRRDQSVGMTVRVQNLTNHPFRSGRSSALRAVFWVVSGDRVVWRSDVGTVQAAVMEDDEWTAGETKTESTFWTGKRCNEAGDALVRGTLQPGTYVARAGWRSGTRAWASPPVEFRVR